MNDNSPKQDIFHQELLEAPRPTLSTMVFQWSKTRADFKINRENFNSRKARGKITIKELRMLRAKMSLKVKYYTYPSEDNDSCARFTCIFIIFLLILSLIGSYYLTKQGNGAYIVMIIWAIFYIVYMISMVYSCTWNYKIRKRAKGIKKLLEEINEEYKDKGVVFTSGKYGSYFIVEVYEEGAETDFGITEENKHSKYKLKDEEEIRLNHSDKKKQEEPNLLTGKKIKNFEI